MFLFLILSAISPVTKATCGDDDCEYLRKKIFKYASTPSRDLRGIYGDYRRRCGQGYDSLDRVAILSISNWLTRLYLSGVSAMPEQHLIMISEFSPYLDELKKVDDFAYLIEANYYRAYLSNCGICDTSIERLANQSEDIYLKTHGRDTNWESMFFLKN